MQFENFKWDQDADGIVTLAWDVPGRTMNVRTNAAAEELMRAAEKVASDDSIKGLIITSAKSNGFCAGAAIDELEAIVNKASSQPEELIREGMKSLMDFHQAMRKLETCGKPVAAAINGLALGAGLEVALACHYRVVADNPKIELGLPESKIGLLPGGGGTQRLPRLVGAMQASPLLLQGQSIDPQQALALKLVHAVVPAGEVVANAKAWIRTKPEPVQPWDRKDFKIPGGGPYSANGSQLFAMGNALLRKETHDNYPAQRYIMSCVYEGMLVPIDAGLRIEARYFVKLLLDPTSRNMMRSLFLSMQELGKGARRPKTEAKTDVRSLGILGAGVMGAGIAYVSALAGIDVVLLDTTIERANAGRDHAARIIDRQIEKGRSTPEKKAEILGRIHTTVDFAAVKDVDLVVEAVFEDRAVKADATRKTCAVLRKGAVFGSNTSALPITGLAEASDRPESFIGIHFFSPVERMALVELIRGKQTNDHALAVAMDFIQKIRKTPIVVNDSRGFYTSRCVITFPDEGVAMLSEAIHPAMIENVARMTGMPMGPLELMDSIGCDTILKARRQARKDLGIAEADAPEELLAWLVEKGNRPGRKTAKGFYDYDPKGKRLRLWPELFSYKSGAWRTDVSVDDMKARFLTTQALEAARCFEEGVITDPRDADIGAILGWGFAPFTGGPISYIDTIGLAAFVRRCDEFAVKYGERFKPNALLRDMAAKGETFYARFAPQKLAA
jgi:3-hydroxyacyl-CoA dehydrogenase/enoyl-CoA hydratase/3-hydroxybutyryl-CoA epimerase